jgi:predicted protein tyrosine phosphatase
VEDDHCIELMVLTASSQNLGGVRFVPVEKLEISWTSLSKIAEKKQKNRFSQAQGNLKNTVILCLDFSGSRAAHEIPKTEP